MREKDMAESRQIAPISDSNIGWWSRRRPELAKVRSLIEVKQLQVELFQEVIDSRPRCEATGLSDSREVLQEILETDRDWRKRLASAHVVNHRLNQLLPLVATDDYIYVTLEKELRIGKDPEHKFSISGGMPMSWMSVASFIRRSELGSSKGVRIDVGLSSC
jgi:hypothetical protein